MADYPAGWYADPRDPAVFRYFDGTGWTPHTSPASAEMPSEPPGMAAGAALPRDWNFGQPPAAPTTGARPPYGTTTPSSREATTPDGAVLSGWGRRLLARLLDGIFAFLLALPLTGYFLVRYFEALTDWERQMLDQATGPGGSVDLTIPNDVVKWLLPIALLQVVVSVGYEALFLHRRGATPGKTILGLRVRLRAEPGRLPASAIARRILVMFGLQLLSLLPVVGVLVGFAALLNYLWPLWDPAKQAWHDKAATTNVVRDG